MTSILQIAKILACKTGESRISTFDGDESICYSVTEYVDKFLKLQGFDDTIDKVSSIILLRFFKNRTVQGNKNNIFRIVFLAIYISAKFYSSNDDLVASILKLSTIPSFNLMRLEMKFLKNINFNLIIQTDEFDNF